MFGILRTPSVLALPFLLSIGAQPVLEPTNTHTAITAVETATATCPVTKPPAHPFEPPSPYPREIPSDRFWFGTNKLWTDLPVNGTWMLGHDRPDDPSFRQKMLWWRQGYDRLTDDPPKLTLTGRRLDSAAPSLAPDDHANAGWTDDPGHSFMVTGINTPTVGCWQITGDYNGDKLTVVVRVQAATTAQSHDAFRGVASRQAWENRSSPVYADAGELARMLSNRGFVVDCIRRSKQERIFVGQKGAAWFKTDKGIFEVWFLPKGESFTALDVIEHVGGDEWYAYFQGTPRISIHMESSKQMFFVKHGNLLFEVWGNKQLATRLDQAVQNP